MFCVCIYARKGEREEGRERKRGSERARALATQRQELFKQINQYPRERRAQPGKFTRVELCATRVSERTFDAKVKKLSREKERDKKTKHYAEANIRPPV